MPEQALARPPRPIALASLGESADGPLSAWLFVPDRPPEPLTLAEIDAAYDRREGVIWVHLNSAATPAKGWLARQTRLPEPIREALLESDPRTRLEPLGNAMLAVIGDTAAGADPDP